MKSIVKLSMALCLAVMCTACNRQKTVAENLDEYFNAVEDRFMGSVAVMTDGRYVYQRHIGFSDVENRVPATDDTPGTISVPYRRHSLLCLSFLGKRKVCSRLTSR